MIRKLTTHQQKNKVKYVLKKSVVMLLFVLHGSTVLSQDELWTKEVIDPQTFSPQVANMIRFDNTASNLNSGRIDLSIPVIKFTDPDFDFPINIQYNSAGFIPSMGDGFTGLNWSLALGGIIYREVKGIPDDFYKEDVTQSKTLKGFLEVTKRFPPLFDNDLVKEEIYTNPKKFIQTTVSGNDDPLPNSLSIYSFPALRGTNIEASSDVYHFTFGKHSGTFLINFDGSVSVVSHNGGHLKVDLSGYFYDYDTGYNTSVIKIITDDGYIYCFGGSYDAMEYMALNWIGVLGKYDHPTPGNPGGISPSLSDNTNQITSFHLSKIIAPNGRELNISYRNMVPAKYHKNPMDLFITINYSGIVSSRINESYTLSGSPYAKGPDSALERSYSLSKIALVDKIRTDDKTVTFYYSPKEKQNDYSEAEVREFGLSCGTRLDSISLQNQGSEVVETTRFGYSYWGGNYSRMFLREVSLSSVGKYSFSYNNIHSLPDPLTKNIDHWKYWRGNRDNQRLIPRTKEIFFNEYEIVSDDRDPSKEAYDVAMLSEVFFPTGGSVHYQYEPHKYRSALKQSSPSFFPKAEGVEENIIAGGARIRKISFYNGRGSVPVKEVQYRYTRDKDSEISSGILMYQPHYTVFRHYAKSGDKNSFISVPLYASSGFNLADYASDHVRYSTVIEYTCDSLQKADSTFRLYITPLDELRQKVFTLRTGEMGSIENKAQCVIAGSGNAKATGKIIIKDDLGRVIREFVFNSSPQEFRFNLLESFPKGTYRVYLQAEKDAYVSIKTDYPGSGFEKIKGSYKETTFTDYRSNPDYSVNSFANGKWVNSWVLPLDEDFFRNFLADPIRKTRERGKPASEFYYDDNSRLVKSVFYTYDRVNTDNGIYIKQPPFYAGTHFGAYTQIGKVDLSPYLLTRTTIHDFTGEGTITTSTSFTYDQYGYLKNIKKQTSEGEDHNTDFVYSFKRNGPVYQEMKQLNMYAPVTDEINRIYRGSDMSIEHLNKTYVLGQTIKRENKLPVVSTVSSSINSSPLETRIQYLNYDTFGNLIYKITEKAIHTVYLWGYQGKYLVAKIENATYDEVKQALGGVLPESLSAIDHPDMNLINGLRSKLPQSYVTTYTYKLLTGVTSETDPSGQTVYYSYDRAGRLTESYLIEGGRKKIVTCNEYNIVNQ